MERVEDEVEKDLLNLASIPCDLRKILGRLDAHARALLFEFEPKHEGALSSESGEVEGTEGS